MWCWICSSLNSKAIICAIPAQYLVHLYPCHNYKIIDIRTYSGTSLNKPSELRTHLQNKDKNFGPNRFQQYIFNLWKRKIFILQQKISGPKGLLYRGFTVYAYNNFKVISLHLCNRKINFSKWSPQLSVASSLSDTNRLHIYTHMYCHNPSWI